jgi:dCMP deaminase
MTNNTILPHEQKWMRVLDGAAKEFSTCAKRQYAAVVVAPNKRVVGFGYNGSPPGVAHCNEGACPRLHEDSASDPGLRLGSTLIINGSPCMGCAKLIASSGVKRVVYRLDPSYNQLPVVLNLLNEAGIEYVSA